MPSAKTAVYVGVHDQRQGRSSRLYVAARPSAEPHTAQQAERAVEVSKGFLLTYDIHIYVYVIYFFLFGFMRSNRPNPTPQSRRRGQRRSRRASRRRRPAPGLDCLVCAILAGRRSVHSRSREDLPTPHVRRPESGLDCLVCAKAGGEGSGGLAGRVGGAAGLGKSLRLTSTALTISCPQTRPETCPKTVS
jgi:hypothetical protein